jgi:hypothetical protein
VREADTKGPTACDSTDRKHPEQENPGIGSGLMGVRAGEGTGWLFLGIGLFLW